MTATGWSASRFKKVIMLKDFAVEHLLLRLYATSSLAEMS